MADFYVDSNGKITTKKKKKKSEYSVDENGKITINNEDEEEDIAPLPSSTPTTAERIEAILKERAEKKEKENAKKEEEDIAPLPPSTSERHTFGKDTPGQNSLTDRFNSKTQTELEKFVTEGETPETLKKDQDDKGLKFFKGGAFSDGFDFLDIVKAPVATAADIATGIVQGLAQMGEGVADLGYFVGEAATDLLGDGNAVEEWFDEKKDLAANWNTMEDAFGNFRMKTGIQRNSLLDRTSQAVTQGIGQAVGTFATAGAGQMAGLGKIGQTILTSGLMFSSSAGGGMSEATQDGASDEEALIYGAAKGVIDAGTEMIFGALGKGTKAVGVSKGLSSFDDQIASALSSKISNRVVKTLVQAGVKASAEGVEELLAGVLGGVAKKLTYMDDESIWKIWEDENLLEQFVVGALSAGFMQGGDVNTSIKTDSDLVTDLNRNEEAVVNKELENRVAEQEKRDGKKLSNKAKNEIYESILKDMDKGYISTDTIEEVLGGETYKSYQDTVKNEDALVEQEKTLRDEFNTLNRLKTGDRTGEQTDRLEELRSQLSDLTSKIEDNKKNSQRDWLQRKYKSEVEEVARGSRLQESYNEMARRGQAFTADLSKYNEKQKAVVQKAIDSGILNNTNRTHELVDFISKISADKGVSFDFTNNAKLKESGFAIDGKTVNGYITKDGIVLNMNSSKVLQSTVGHEITHVLEGTELYTELQTAIINYAKTKGDYQGRLDTLTKLYEGVEGADINAELTADLVGDYLFQDADFVNNLSAKHRNVFQRIYDEIKYLVKTVTAGSKEARELEKVKHVFEQAYRAQKNTAQKGGTQWSIYLTENDIPDYLQAGNRQNKNRQMRYEEGQQMIVSTDAEFDSFVKKSVEGNHNEMVAYGKVDESLAKQVKEKSNSQIDIADAYLELLSDDLQHAYREHSEAKEPGDLDMTVDDLIYALKNVNQSEVISARQYKDGGQRATLAIPTDDGMMMLVELASKSAGSLRLKTGWKVTNEKFAQKYRGSTSTTGSKSSTNTVRDGTTSNGSIAQTEENVNTKFSLSEEQQEYFKDSVVRDENGNLKVMYHGTSQGGHTMFDPYGKAKYGLFGAGSYFTDSKTIAESYTKKGKGNNPQVYESYLNITNPIDMDAQADPAAWKKALPDAAFPESGTNEDFYRAMEEYFEDNQYPRWAAAETAMEVIEGMGYDGITHIGGGRVNADGERHQVYIAFQPEQIKDIGNVSPTSDPDIRFSLSEADNTYLDAVKRGDMETAQKMVYETAKSKGYTINAYHGTPHTEFTVFDKERVGKGNDQYGAGFYFATSKDAASHYGGRVISSALDIKNPIRITATGESGRNLIDAEIELTSEQAYEVVKRHPDMYDEENSPLGDYFDSYWEDGAEDWMVESLAEQYRDVGYLDSDLFRNYPNELHEALRDVVGWDGVEVTFETTGDKFYVAWFDNQMKSTDPVTYDDDGNIIPLSNRFDHGRNDIRNSLSEEGNVPQTYGNFATPARDLLLENAQEDIAPVVTDTNVGRKTADVPVTETEQDMFPDDYAPLSEEETAARQSEILDGLSDEDAPPEVDAPYYGEFDDAAPYDPFENRDMKEVGNRKVKAYMYENPEVKPFFQSEANIMLGELKRTTKGEKWFNDDLYYETNGEKGWGGTTRQTSDEIAYLLDELGYTYAQIEKGLNAIIEDDGAENNAISKRIEFLLHDRLSKGYTDFEIGHEIPANQDYVNLLAEKGIAEYNDEARQNFFDNADQYVPPMEEDIAPVVQSAPKMQATEDIAPVAEEYEAITPKKSKPKRGNKLVRADNVTPEQAQIARVLDAEPGTTTKKSRAWAKFKANVLDKGAVFEDISLKTRNRELMGKWNYMLYSEARAQSLMGSGTDSVKSLNNIRDEVAETGKTKEFYEYLYHKHNIDRMSLADRFEETTNKPVFGDTVTAEVSMAEVARLEEENPQFKKYAKDVYAYNDHLRQMLEDGGVVSHETAELWKKMYPHYVPIRRTGESGLNINVALDTRRTGVNAPVKRATGGNSDILPLFDTMAMRTVQTFKAVAKNNFGVELKNALGTTIERQATELDEVIDSIDQQDGLLQEGKNGRSPTFTVFENGEKVTYEITEDMYDAMKPMSEGMAYTNKVLNTVSNVHRGVLTEYNPVFMLTNAVKDIQDVFINSQHSFKTYAKVPEAFAQLTKKGYWYQEYMANGGDQNTYFDNETHTFKTENKGLAKLLDLPPLSTISKLNNFIEMTPRLAEYIASREAGRSVEVSMLDAARVTTNFRAGGDITKFLNRNGATFLNASVQGAMQQVRNVREANANGLKGWVNLAAKFALAGLPVLLLNGLVWEDDEEYEELSDYVKQNYYIVGKYGDGKFIRIPKGRTMAVIQNAFEQIANAVTGDDEADLKSFLELAVSNLAPNNPIENNILSPIIQVANNETWYGDELVPKRLQDLPAAEQFDESTDSFSKWLGGKLNISPYKINYLLDQYSGGVGDTILPMITPEAESGDNSLGGNLLAPLKSKFTADSVMNNQNVSDFYDKMDELTKNAKSSKATDKDVLMYKYMNSVNADLSELYAKKREIQNSNLSDSQKYAQVRDVQEQIVELTRNALNAYKDVQVGKGQGTYYARVADVQFKWDQDETDPEGRWVKLNDKQIDKQNKVTAALGITPDEYWSNAKEEYDYAYENPGKYAVAKAVGGYDAFKTYSSDLYDIKADKDSDGKSISGSRKDKVADYINGLDIGYGEKILLFKSEYPSDDSYNTEIIEYLDSRSDISYEEMVTILTELGFKVNGNTVTWD